ncbi:hypothetical protein GQ54DRAFT_84118 [Martensiomyces pterosporus]|nr:hypothetical protein GQ54DRAFT_84118 [Martensiomyces pterosporus]
MQTGCLTWAAQQHSRHGEQQRNTRVNRWLLRSLTATQCGMEDINGIEERVGFVLCELHLPRQWLYEAYSTRSRFDRDWVEARLAVQQPVFPVKHPVSVAMRKTSTGRQTLRSFFGQHMSPSRQRDGRGMMSSHSSAAWSAFCGGAPLAKTACARWHSTW